MKNINICIRILHFGGKQVCTYLYFYHCGDTVWHDAYPNPEPDPNPNLN